MSKALINMINSNSINVYQYFTMNPYSYSVSKIYNEVGFEGDYYNDINLISNKTFERLAILAKIAQNKEYNTLIITGYKGSGKSNFLRFCDAVINNRANVKKYNSVYMEHRNLYQMESTFSTSDDSDPDFFDENFLEKSINELKKIKSCFEKSIIKIKEILETDFKYKSNEVVKIQIANFLNNTIHGESVYLDFDKGKRDDKTPLELKLTRHIEKHIKKITVKDISDLYEFYARNSEYFTEAFENRSKYLFESVLKFIYKNKNNLYDDYKDDLLSELGALEIDQLLSLEVLLQLSQTREQNNTGNLYYILDNLDMISGQENSVLINTISNFWKFTEEMQSFMTSLQQDKTTLTENELWIQKYNKIIYIFAMRETTAMHIGDHLRNRIEQYAQHFDMSSDVNKSFIIKKRYNLLKKYIDEGKIHNEVFVTMVNTIEKITEDKYYKWSFFPMFNDDYRTAINCLYEVCIEKNNINILHYESEPLLCKREAYKKFGGRGIIIKTLCDSFRRWGYFSDLKIGAPAAATEGSKYNITMIRIILIILQNLQKERTRHSEIQFFVDREQSVSIKSLYEKTQSFCSEKMFINCIENMFSIRNCNYWNHLITFDNILEYSENDIKKGITGEKAIYIRCTEAGEMYLKILCIHYEFFACRDKSESAGLFCRENYQKDKKQDVYPFESQIQNVLNKVTECCKNLQSFNKLLLKCIGGNCYGDILKSDYVKDKKLHEERIIHNHISYLDAFRLFLINEPLKYDIININKKLIGFINDYLELLKDSNEEFYSDNSEKLYKELKCCIDIIATKNNYYDRKTVISREYYIKNIECKDDKVSDKKTRF